MDLNTIPARICLDYVMGIKRKLRPLLFKHKLLERRLGKIVKEKTGEHMQYGFDVLAHDFLVKQLEKKSLNVRLFSEESGWLSIGTGKEYLIIADPFDGSHQATRTFRDVATAICVVDQNYEFKFCAIAEFNTHLLYIADKTGAYVSYTQKLDPLYPSMVQSLSEAYIILPGMKQKRRQYLCKTRIVSEAKYLLNTDGIVNLGRLAAGYIDAYIDPYIGQPIYEIVYSEIARQAGAVVSDIYGKLFDLPTLIHDLESDSDSRYKIIATCSERLHHEILNIL